MIRWPPGTTIEAVEDFPFEDYDHKGNQTVIRKGATGTVGRGDGGQRIRLDPNKVDHWYGSTIYDTPYLWEHHRDRFKVINP